jgi:predicted transcriptional regulator
MIELQRHEKIVVPGIPDVLDVMTLLSLPDHLRKTAVTLCKLGDATADQIAEQTKRARAVESGYLNQLVTMGYLQKERRGRRAYFYVNTEGES